MAFIQINKKGYAPESVACEGKDLTMSVFAYKSVTAFVTVTVFLLSLVATNVHAANLTAEQTVRNTTNVLLENLRNNKATLEKNPEYINDLVNNLLVSHFDVQKMSRLVMGKYWRKADKEQKKQFPREFMDLLIRTYSVALLSYTDQEIRYLPGGKSDAQESTVKTEILQSGGPSIPISYRLHKTKNQWMVYDINIDGISLVNTYRSSFANEIRTSGIDGLIRKLKAKNQRVAKAQ